MSTYGNPISITMQVFFLEIVNPVYMIKLQTNTWYQNVTGQIHPSKFAKSIHKIFRVQISQNYLTSDYHTNTAIFRACLPEKKKWQQKLQQRLLQAQMRYVACLASHLHLFYSCTLYDFIFLVFSLSGAPINLTAHTEWILRIMENVCLMSQPGGKHLKSMM